MKPLSDFLEQLITEANEAIDRSQITIKEKLLYVYNAALEEGYTPKESKKIMKDKIPLVSDRYIRQVLPDEAKNLNMRRLPNSGTVPQIPKDIVQTTPKIVDIEISDDEGEAQEQQALSPFTATEHFLKMEQEFHATEQLLREERAKTAELQERLELERNEHEATVARLEDRALELDRLTDKLTDQLQEKSRQLTNLTMQFDNAIPEPTPEQNYSIETDVPYNGKKIPVVVRCFISGRKVGWIDRDVYKARYGKEPQEE